MKNQHPLRLIVADLDGTLLHDGVSFETRALTERTITAVTEAHDAGIRIAVATARPVRTSWDIVHQIPVDACVYLNGALIDLSPSQSSYALLTASSEDTHAQESKHLHRFGFSSGRARQVCTELLSVIPNLRLGVVMNDQRYTNFDIHIIWPQEECHLTDFTDLPQGRVDKIIIFPRKQEIATLRASLPRDFELHISEGSMWMLMNPQANKRSALQMMCAHMQLPLSQVAAFGDDAIDISMLQAAGIGVAVSNAIPEVLRAADQICPSNNDDGVAEWIDTALKTS
ncbi:MAG: HAD family hydrolase [Bifidobacterium sp.]|jgi:Cof subfamily protein (haloacid dehalogenase superfamily)|nr:HAD family hydrolase [Bifidobacterium sp.]MCH4174358.1 HAD family hydrolase [Bifidobacterium sp.]